MIRRFFRDSAIYSAPAMISRAIGFLLFVLFAHELSPADYGVVDLLTIAGILVNLTVALEISQGLGRFYAMSDDERDQRGYASTALWFTVLTYSAFAAVALAAAAPIAEGFLGGDASTATVRIAVGWMWFTGILYLLQEQLRWQLRPRPYAVSSFANVLLTAAASVLAVLVLDWGVPGLFAGQLVGGALATALTIPMLKGTYRLAIDRDLLHKMLIYSLPLVPASIGVFLSGFVDRLAINSQLGLTDVGIYGAAFKVGAAVALVTVGFQAALTPLVLTRHARPETPAELSHVFRYFTGVAIAAFVVVSVFADAIFDVIAPAAYADGAKLVPWLVLSTLFAGMYVFAPGMSIAGRTKPLAVVNVLAGLVNAALAFALVAALGTSGAAIATFATSLAAFVALMVISQRLYPVPHGWRALAFAFAASVCAVVGNQLLTIDGPLDHDGITELVVKLAIVGLGGALVAVLLVRPEDRAAFQTLRRMTRQAFRPESPAAAMGPLADSSSAPEFEERVGLIDPPDAEGERT